MDDNEASFITKNKKNKDIEIFEFKISNLYESMLNVGGGS